MLATLTLKASGKMRARAAKLHETLTKSADSATGFRALRIPFTIPEVLKEIAASYTSATSS